MYNCELAEISTEAHGDWFGRVLEAQRSWLHQDQLWSNHVLAVSSHLDHSFFYSRELIVGADGTHFCLITTHLLSIEGTDWPKLHDMFKACDDAKA